MVRPFSLVTRVGFRSSFHGRQLEDCYCAAGPLWQARPLETDLTPMCQEVLIGQILVGNEVAMHRPLLFRAEIAELATSLQPQRSKSIVENQVIMICEAGHVVGGSLHRIFKRRRGEEAT
jgi:hypothetical protein